MVLLTSCFQAAIPNNSPIPLLTYHVIVACHIHSHPYIHF
uniref:Uncharacterized protein n=1 Tax=Rhizophora mucronata TaxID=61149 RepID=A0A2P2NMP4_RHIMU